MCGKVGVVEVVVDSCVVASQQTAVEEVQIADASGCRYGKSLGYGHFRRNAACHHAYVYVGVCGDIGSLGLRSSHYAAETCWRSGSAYAFAYLDVGVEYRVEGREKASEVVWEVHGDASEQIQVVGIVHAVDRYAGAVVAHCGDARQQFDEVKRVGLTESAWQGGKARRIEVEAAVAVHAGALSCAHNLDIAQQHGVGSGGV